MEMRTSIIVIGKESQVVATIVEMAQACGYNARGIDNSRTALGLLQEACFDVVLIAGQRSGLEPVSFARDIKKVAPYTQVIIASSFVPEITDLIDVAEYLKKPFSIADLKRVIKKMTAAQHAFHSDGKSAD
jgi:DNA-binding NtrC family response regulator